MFNFAKAVKWSTKSRVGGLLGRLSALPKSGSGPEFRTSNFLTTFNSTIKPLTAITYNTFILND